MVDTYFTDDPLEAERVAEAEKASAYEVRVTRRPDAETAP